MDQKQIEEELRQLAHVSSEIEDLIAIRDKRIYALMTAGVGAAELMSAGKVDLAHIRGFLERVRPIRAEREPLDP